MADGLAATAPLAGVLAPGRSGQSSGAPGVVASVLPPRGCAELAARAGRAAELAKAVPTLGLALPERPGWSEGGGWEAVWLGPARWLVFGAGDVEPALRDRLGALAAVVDQSDARVVLRLSGPCVRDTLAKGVPIDLHPAAFRRGDAAVTLAAQIGVLLWQTDDAPIFHLAVARSYAASLAEWLIEAAAEYGLLVE